jgi:phospholipid/cholesterol/gamma-HCH transport system permease protein
MNLPSRWERWSPAPPDWTLEATDRGARVVCVGDWTIRTVGLIEARVDELSHSLASSQAISAPMVDFDLTQVGTLDTAGALILTRLTAAVPTERLEIIGASETHRVLLDEVVGADRPEPPAPPCVPPVTRILSDLGRYGLALAEEILAVLQLLGSVARVLVVSIRRPSRIRFIPFVNQLEHTALAAAPIILLMSFLIGAIIAQQGAFYFRRFGADLYVVDMVGVLSLREIAVLLTAVMVAGRSGSAFTAELGSMKMREEVDALKVIGLDPIEMLVVPRIMALMLALPILTFLADIASLLGAAVVCKIYAGIPTETFIERLKGAIALRTFLVGVCKAPFMALIIGLVASMEGLRVKGSAESLGAQTTLSVVKSIFMVIVVDGIFAMFYAAVGV